MLRTRYHHRYWCSLLPGSVRPIVAFAASSIISGALFGAIMPTDSFAHSVCRKLFGSISFSFRSIFVLLCCDHFQYKEVLIPFCLSPTGRTPMFKSNLLSAPRL